MKRSRSIRWSAGLALLLFAPPSPAQLVPTGIPVLEVCGPGEVPELIALERLWEVAADRDPGYLTSSHLVVAEQELRSAARRAWFPATRVEGIGNHGQRLSPSEERNLGVGPRGELRLLGSFALLDSNRSGLSGVAEGRVAEAIAAERAFGVEHRSMLALLYAEAGTAEAIWEASESHLNTLLELAGPIEARVAEGVELGWEANLLDEALARAERIRLEAEQVREGFVMELSLRTGRCVRAEPLRVELGSFEPQIDLAASPEVARLSRAAEVLDAQARLEAGRDRWQFQVLGGVGPNHSRAFGDDRVRNEYLVGVGVSWGLDLAGVRGRMAASEAARADAVRAEAEALRQAQEREWGRIRVALDLESERRTELAQERERAEHRRDMAVLRWREGVDRWTEVLQAGENVLDLTVTELELELELFRALIREAEMTGRLEEIPPRIGQGGGS